MTVILHSSNNKSLSYQNIHDCLNNQISITGENQEYYLDFGTILLFHLEAVPGTTVTISDGRGKEYASGVSGFTFDHIPLRLDYGVKITGNVSLARGYVINNCFQEKR